MRRLRRQRPVNRSINLNDPLDSSNAAEDEDDKTKQPEEPDMMRINSLETKAAEAKRLLVAEFLGCLDPRERRVIEGRLGLNGYREPVTHKELAAEFGLSAPRIKQIEDEAAAKLRAVLAGDLSSAASVRISY
jgi:RNA polymerase sigma factor (sigma-70 family)